MRPSRSAASKGGEIHSRGSPSVTTSVWPSRRRLFRPGPFSPEPRLHVRRDLLLVGVGIVGAVDTRDADESAGELHHLVAIDAREDLTESLRRRRATTRGQPEGSPLLQRERQDHGIEPDDPVLLSADVEVVSFHFLGVLLEGDDGAYRRHLAEGVGPFVEAVAATHHLAVADRRAPPALRAHPSPG